VGTLFRIYSFRVALIVSVSSVLSIYSLTQTVRQATASPTERTLPSDVASVLMRAPKTTDIYSVSESKQMFNGQILKADVITFQSGTGIVFNNFKVPWIAIVAKKIQFVDPSSNNAIFADSEWVPGRYSPPAPPPPPGQAPKASECHTGPAGANGATGTKGRDGDTAPKIPKIYVIVGALIDQNEVPLPKAFRFTIDVLGFGGGDAGNGSQGSVGGQGGDGGSANWHEPKDYPLDPGCKCGAGDGGPGGIGGLGGPGGKGGAASPGGDLELDAPQAVLDSFYYSRFYNEGNGGGAGGVSGPSGPSGDGGVRGEHPGACGGGNSGLSPRTPITPVVRGANGANSPQGTILQDVDDNVARFF
jgi:hypothetical protein